MEFAHVRATSDPQTRQIAEAIVEDCVRRGHRLVSAEQPHTFILNELAFDRPLVHHRSTAQEFVVGLVKVPSGVADLRSACYTVLVQSLSNLLFGFRPGDSLNAPEFYCVTPEVGFVRFLFDVATVFRLMEPVVTSHFVLENRIVADLRMDTLPATELDDLVRFGGTLNNLGLLPAPFPFDEVLSPEVRRHAFRLFGLKGLSYGNLSVRSSRQSPGSTEFWMSARGVDKGRLQGLGRDIVLVTDFDADRSEMVIHVPPVFDRRIRVSVDAIEHFLVYRSFPAVGAIVHVHGWLDGALSTTQVYPCGTRELAEEVVAMLSRCNRPEAAAVGLKNHGVTITGTSLSDIFHRIDGKLRTQVPMGA